MGVVSHGLGVLWTQPGGDSGCRVAQAQAAKIWGGSCDWGGGESLWVSGWRGRGAGDAVGLASGDTGLVAPSPVSPGEAPLVPSVPVCPVPRE